MVNKNTWRFFKADLLRKYKEQISKKSYFKHNASLLNIAVKTNNQALFDDIVNSPYIHKAMAETDLYGYSPLYHAMFEMGDFFEKLAEKDTDLMAVDAFGTPFLLTCYQQLQKNATTYMMPKYHKVYTRIKEALKNVKNVDIQTDEGETFLTTALKYNDSCICRLLLDKGASPLRGAVRIRGDKLNALEYALYRNEFYAAKYMAEHIHLSDSEYATSVRKTDRLKNLKRVVLSEIQSYLIVAGVFVLSGGIMHIHQKIQSDSSQKPESVETKQNMPTTINDKVKKIKTHLPKQPNNGVMNERTGH